MILQSRHLGFKRHVTMKIKIKRIDTHRPLTTFSQWCSIPQGDAPQHCSSPFQTLELI